MKYRTLSFLLLIFFYGISNAQTISGKQPIKNTTPARNCGTMQYLQMQQQQDPGLEQQMLQIEQHTQQIIQKQLAGAKAPPQIIIIPVVFHVVYNNATENISNAQVLSQLTVLNEDYRRQNADTTNTPVPFKSLAADVEIQFCIATVDPIGNATSGITRTATTHGPFSTNDDIKFNANGGKDAWPRDSYLNFWIGNLGGGLLGYAQFPGGPANTDGIVCTYTSIGRPPANPFGGAFNLGRTASHEVGHWLNLRHIWADDGGACSGSDLVNDTPNQGAENTGCPAFPRTDACTPASPGVMYMDYMDYTDDNCMNLFTLGQKTRMRALFNTGGAREPLLVSTGCGTLASNDAGIAQIISPPSGSFCNDSIFPMVTLQNFGSNALTSVTINYQLDGGTINTYSWTGNLSTGQTANITLPAQPVSAGGHTYTAYTTLPNGTTDGNATNDASVVTFTVTSPPAGAPLPFQQGFETNPFPPTGWALQNGGNTGYTWARTTAASGYGTSAASTRMDNYSSPSSIVGDKDALVSPAISFTSVSTPVWIKWDRAYARYDNTTNDSLNVYYSIDCEATWVRIYNKGGTGLATAANTTAAFVPNANQWAKDSVNINVLLGQTSVKFKFESVSAWGNYLYLDNINLYGATSVAPPVADFSGTPVSICQGSTVNFTDLSTNNPTSWLWSFSGGTPSSATTQNPVVTYNTPGTYTVSLIAANAGGSDTVNKVNYITVNANPTATIAGTNVSCNGGSNGSANLTVTSGATPFTYIWSNGATTQDLTGLSPGTYIVTVTDANNCKTISSVTISQPTALNTTTSSVNASCPGTCNGNATVSASGGTTPYTYLWSASAGNQTTATATGLCGGTYNVTVTDANSCQKTANVTVNSNPGPNSSFTASANQCLAGNSFNFSNTGDLPNSCGMNCPVFSWNYGDGNNSSGTSSAAANPSHSYITAGTYTVTQTITNGSGCSSSSTKTVIVFAPPSASISGTNPSCNGGSNGAANLTPSGGTSPYTYLWSLGATTQDLSGLTAATYSVTVTDLNSCSATASVTLTNPPAMTLTTGSTNASCGNPDGVASVSASGGLTPYSYLWSNGATTQNATGLAAGTYSVTVTNANTCQKSATVTISSVGGPSANINGTNVSCNGGSNGMADLVVSGGATPYTYSWNTGSTSQDLNGIPAGNYSVSVTDANSCQATASITITQPTAISATVAGTNVSCNGGNNGAANLTVSGGSPVYTFLWSNGATTEDITGLAAGTYNVTVTDSKSCQKTASVTITQPTSLVAIITGTNVSCNGGTNGAADLTPSGGTTPYTYLWSNGASTQDLTAISAGNYSVTVTDSKGCTKTSSVTISQPSVITISISTTSISCTGGNNGTATANPSGGTTPYSYNWSNGSTTQTITGLAAGNYTVTVTDANSCQKTANANVSQPGGMTTSITGVNVSCNGGNNGSLNLTVSGGTIPYTYNWSNGAITQDLSGLSAGTYNVTITDGNSCSATTGITITQPSALTAGIIATNISCNGNNDGVANLTPSGGTTPYFYSWSNGASTQDISGLIAGSYTVTVTDSNACQTTASTVITEPSTLSDTAAITHVSCNGGNNGAINLTPSGGSTPYTYLWSNNATTQDLTGLTAGTYSVTISDNNNCTISSSFTINQPAAISILTSSVSVSCNGGNNGSATATPSNGNSPYSYSWSTSPAQNTSTATGLTAGSYTVTVTDNSGCTKTASVTVSQPAVLNAGITGTNITCNGLTNGSADLAVSGGTTSYSYIWNTGATTQDISGLAAGSYSVTVTDAKGCTKTAVVTISEPAAISLNITGTNATCNGVCNGAADLAPSGGTSPYIYNWSNGQTTQDIFSLCAGTYNVTVTDTMGCSSAASVTISQPAALSVSTGSTNASCGGTNGTASVIASGGVSPYSYLWSNGATTANITGLAAGTYSVTVTGINGCSKTASVIINEAGGPTGTITGTNVSCNGGSNGAADLTVSGGSTPYTYNWSNSATTQDVSGLTAGTYSVTITDFNGCQAFRNVSITQPAALSTGISGIDANCNGTCDGSANLSVTGGTPVYSYSWSNGTTTQDISGVCAGFYKVTVTDSKNCQAIDSIGINQSVGLFLAITGNNVTCNGLNNGSANLTVSGGTIPYSYLWSNGATSEDLAGLNIGTYHVTVTDGSGCQNSDSITISEPATLSASIAGTDVSCGSVNNGSANLSVSGGVMPYSYTWSNGATTQDISGLVAGTYYVTINDSNNCQITDTVIINQSSSISINIIGTNSSCNGASDGAANLTVTSGASPFTYIWSNGSTTEDISGLSAGTYSVTVNDLNCSAVDSVVISEPAPLNPVISGTNPSCKDYNDGSADLTVTGGTAPYSFYWSNGTNSEDQTKLTAGTYTVTVTDANGCQDTASVTLTNPSGMTIFFIDIVDASCNGNNDGEAEIFVGGGAGSYTFLWSTGQTTNPVTNFVAGIYTVTITDASGCTIDTTIIINDDAGQNLNINTTDVNCYGGNDGSASASATGGSLPYTWDWSTGATTTSITGLTAGTYTVTNTDNNGCMAIEQLTIFQPDSINLNISVTNASCTVGNDGAANLNISGGISPYSYVWSNGATTQDISNLTPGTYTVTVTDDNSCIAIESVTIIPASGITANIINTITSCYGTCDGAADLQVTGGVTPYTYFWTNGATTQDLFGVCAGIYSVTITDATGCNGVGSTNINQPSAISTSFSITGASCNGFNDGAIDMIVSGGNPAFSFIWSTGATTEDIAGLNAGNYYITITDANNCQLADTATVTAPSPASFLLTGTDATCFGNCDGTASLIIPLKVALICGDPACSDVLRDVPLRNYMQDSLGYIVTPFEDANMGWNTDSFNLIVISESVGSGNTAWLKNNKAGILTLEGNNFDEFELGNNGSTGGGGSMTVFVVNNTHFITQPFSAGTLTVTTSTTNLGEMRGWANDVTNLAYYTADNTRSKLLYAEKGTVLQGGTNLAAGRRVFYGARYFNNLNNNGRILFTRASLWAASVSYSWSNGSTSQDQSNLCAGTYFVTITDSTGCQTMDSIMISEPAILDAAITGTNISCNGSADGIADLIVSGGSTPYTYLWSTGAITQDLSGLSPGTYSVTLTDANNCMDTSGVIITEPVALTSTTSETDASCNGGNDGSITVNPTGGTTPYSYIWSSGGTTQTVPGLPAGTYSVTLTDANGCFNIHNPVINDPTPILLSTSATNASCGGADGSATVTPSGGSSPYSYLWNTGGNTATISNLSVGTYSVTVTDFNNCTAIASATVNNPIPAITASTTPVSCSGGSNGTINITLSGGATPYSYLWSNGATVEDLSGIPAGNYSVTATDVNGCQTVKDTFISQPPTLVSSITGANETCAGTCNGTANLSVSGGTTSYTYSWSNGATTQNLAALCSGTYYVTISDGNSCQKTDSIIIGSGMNLSASSINNSCNGDCNGAINLTVSGGTPGYSYNWSNGAITQNLSGLCSGNYSVTVTDAASCQKTLSFSITEPAIITASFANTNISCNGVCNGSSNLTVSGGTSPYSFFWSNSATSEDVSSLCAGNYNVTITDSSGCQNISSTTISQPASIALALANTNVTCNGDSNGGINLTVSGGTTPYSYNWSNGAVTEDLNGLSAGTYFVTVTDGGSCAKTAQVTVNQPSLPVAASLAGTDISCNGANNGSINHTPSGGTVQYSYLWSNGSVTEDLSGLTAGIYSITVSDANGCQATGADTISEPSPLSATSAVTNITCNGGNNGAILLTPSGGVSPYSFLWSNNSTTEDINGLSAGTYSVTITDSNGCTSNLAVNISQPANMGTTVNSVNVSCQGGANGALDLAVTGGNAPYSYSWSNGATSQDITGLSAASYSVTITDANGCTKTVTSNITEPSPLVATSIVSDISCSGSTDGAIDLTATGGSPSYTYNWSNSATTQDLGGLAAGIYTVTVTDAGGCSINLTDTVNAFQGLSAVTSDTDITCFGENNGSASITPSGGNTPYSYNWSNGEITQSITGLAAGTYQVVLTDNNGCQTNDSAVITEPAALTDSMIVSNVTCSGGSDGAINTIVTGGISPYSYNWSNGAATQNVSGLSAGSYTVTINDANSCSITSSSTINQSSVISTSLTTTNVSCNGDSTGSVSVVVSGGTSPYSFLWSNGSTAQNQTGLSVGTYNLSVTDSSGCSKTTSAVISQPSALNTSVAGINPSCNGTNDGSANLTVSGGTPNYSYNWSNGAATQDINSLSPGAYTVTVTDANSCDKIDSVIISQPDTLTLTTSSTDVSCNGGNDGSADITVSGGTSPYNYSWSNGATSSTLTGISTGTHSVTVSDFNNCQGFSSVTINSPAALAVTTSFTDASCGQADGSSTVTVNGGVSPYTYQWSSGGTAATETGLSAGSYSATVTDSNGCTDTVGVNISNIGGPAVAAVITDASCQNISDGAIDITVTGGLTPYTFNWSNSATSEDITGLAGGNYTVTVTETGGCKTILSSSVNTPPPIISGTAATNASCIGFCDGAADLIVSGGTPGYTYSWSNGATTQDLSGLCAGTYIVTITDAGNCQVAASVTIVDTIGISLNFAVTNPSCTGTCDGSINSSVSGGQPSYTYQWSNGGITSNLNGLCSGTYYITVTDANGCQGNDSVDIITPSSIAAGILPSNITCNGMCNGSIDLTPSGGASPYNYAWSNNSSAEDISGLCSGTYSVTITDDNGCGQSFNTAITEPPVLVISSTVAEVSCNGGNDGAINLTVTGGVPGYSYIWSNGNTVEDIANLTANVYTVTITDSSGCSVVASSVISEPSLISASVNSTNATCGMADGSASVSITGGTTPYSYLWSSGGTSDTESGLAAGTYYLSISDTNGCTVSEQVIISNYVPSLVITSINVTCNGSNNGSASVTASGGATPYTYLWSSGGTASTENGLIAGTYFVSVSDSSGCMAIQSFTITEPAALYSTLSSTGATCSGSNDGTATVSVSGGISPYNYVWSSGGNTSTETGLGSGNYYITITDSNNCSITDSVIILAPSAILLTFTSTPANCNGNNGTASISASGGIIPYSYLWSNGQTGASATGLVAGTYDVTVADANNCTATVNISVGNIGGPTVAITGTNSLCAGSCNGFATANISAGVTPYSYLWDDPSSQTSQVASGLCAGTYNVTVIDSAGCSDSSVVIITEPAALALSSTISNPAGGNCNGIAVVIASGGTSPYSYQWNDTSNQITSIATGLCAGIYCVAVADSNGCVDTACVTLTDTTSILCNLSVNISSTNDFCSKSEGSITVTSANGTTPYSYQWTGTGQTTSAITGLSAGTYSVTVTDNSGCTDTASVALNSFTPLALTDVKTDESCPEANDGMIDVTISGGTQPYNYLWSNNATTEDITQISAGNYSVTVSDANGCDITDTFEIRIIYETCLNIPTAFTPNGDGKNDQWIIRGLNNNSKVEIYNRWGSLLFSSTGYSEPWDGTFDGKKVPTATYYYIITMEDGTSYTGFVRIVR